jgi:hypothetical protein
MGPLAFPRWEVGEPAGDSMMGSCALEIRDIDDLGAYICRCAYEWAFYRGSRNSSPATPIHLYPSPTQRTPRDVHATLSLLYFMTL